MGSHPDLQAAWTVLAAQENDDDRGQDKLYQTVSLGVSVAAGQVLAGVDAQKNRHLLIPLLPGEAAFERSNGAALRIGFLKFSSGNYLSAQCTMRRLDGVFAQFARELLDTLRDSTSPAQDAVSAFEQWRELFAAAAGPGLSESAQIGLLAELQLLESLLAVSPSLDLTGWAGPDGAEHDFRNGLVAIEVKATLTREGRRIGINGVGQLEAPGQGSGELYLAHTQYERADDGDSLPAVIARLREQGVDRSVLDGKLRSVGYFDSHRASYEKSRFALKSRRMYDTKQQHFPKITPADFLGGDLPAGIESIKYVIDLSNEPPHPLSPEGEQLVLQKFLNS